MKKMKGIKRCVLTLAGVTALTVYTLSAQTNQEALSITLDDALEIALSENPTIRIADREVTKQQYAKKGTYASLFPQVDFSAGYQRVIKKQTMYMDGMSIPGTEESEGSSDAGGIQIGRKNNWDLGFTATMPLISVPLWKSLQISGYDVELSIEKARSSRIELIDQVNCAFYTVLLARDAYGVYKQAYDNAVYNYNEIKQKYDQGLLAEYDLIRANVNVKNAEPNMYDAENSLILAHWQLKALLGLDLEGEIVCIGTLSDFDDTLIPDLLAIDTNQLAGNSTLKQLDIQYNQLEKNKQLQAAQYYPSLNMQFNYQWTSMSNNFRMSEYKWNPYSTLGVSLTIPIFSGGKRYSNVKQAQISMKQLEDQYFDTERNIRLAVKQYTDQMSTCIKQYNAASAGVTEAEKSYTITMKRYETGEGTLLEINDAQLSLTQAQLNLNQAIYNYLVAKSSLEKTLGSNSL